MDATVYVSVLLISGTVAVKGVQSVLHGKLISAPPKAPKQVWALLVNDGKRKKAKVKISKSFFIAVKIGSFL